MTAEIAILNTKGIALAADSAVSIGSKKIYNSANKLFTLSKNHPVGIMIYGNAEFMSVPWETIIKSYRNDYLLSKSFATLEEYAQNFIEYLKQTPNVNNENEEFYISTSVSALLENLKNDILIEIDAEFKKNPSEKLTAEDISKITDQIIRSKWDESSQVAELQGATRSYKTRLRHIVSPIFSKLSEQVFELIPLTKQNQKRIFDFCLWSFYKNKFEKSYTGVVISGFGTTEIYPRVVSFNMEGRTLGLLKYQRNEAGTGTISVGNQAAILPFAQREMVDTFMCGIDPELRRFFSEQLENLMKNHFDEVIKGTTIKSSKKDKLLVTKRSNELLMELRHKFNNVQNTYFVQPIIESVRSLPLDELASMAQALVNLTSFKRRVTMEAESVGGPIDVAVISKGDGFVWIQRKHYFKPELNHHYFNNYFDRQEVV